MQVASSKIYQNKSQNISLISQEDPCMICNNDLFMKHLDLHWAYSPDHVFSWESAAFLIL